MNEQEELELLDLDDDAEIEMPEGFESSPRPRRPWLLLGASALVIALASYIIIRIAGTDPDNVVDIRLDLPVQEQPAEVTAAPPPVEPEAEPTGVPVRVVEDRPDAKFNPNAGTTPTVEVPRPRPVSQSTAARDATPPPPASKPAPVVAQPKNTATGWTVQMGAYDSRESALAGERRLRARHKSLFEGRSFVVLAAQVGGQTKYRLRVTGFETGGDANGFCRNAKSDGLDCFVAR